MSLIRQGLDPSGLEVTQGYHSGSGVAFSGHGVIVQGAGSPQLLIGQGYTAGVAITLPDVRAIAVAGLRQLLALAGLRQPTATAHALQPAAVPVAGPLVWSAGNQPPDSALWLQNTAAGNAAIDLGGCAVTARLSTSAGLDLWSGRGCTIPTPASAGQVRVPWENTDFTAAGSYHLRLTIQDSTGRTQTTLRAVPITVQRQP